MKEISIGILIPTSGILPMGKQFDRSFKKAIKEKLEGSDFEIEFITEMIGQGNPVLIEKALDQFFGYHDVDFVTGLVSSRAMEGFVDRFEKRQTPMIMNNLGEHLIRTTGYNDYLLINSSHLWQHSWLMGRYAAKKLGKKGLILGSMFDGGYAFLPSFQLGLMSEYEDFEHDLRLLPMPQPGKLSEVEGAFDVINMEEYDFVFPLFCGEEATIFLEEFHSRGLHKKVKLIGLPFLMLMGERDLAGLELISTVKTGEVDKDWLWENTFTQMGERSGKAIGEAILAGGSKVTPQVLNEVFKKLDKSKEFQSTQVPRIIQEVDLVKHSISEGNKIKSEVIESMELELKDDPKIKQSRDAISSAWMNSYLAV